MTPAAGIIHTRGAVGAYIVSEGRFLSLFHYSEKELIGMRREPMPMSCRLTVGSGTQAMRAQRVLTAAGLRCEVIKDESPDRRRGCAYALAYDCLQKAPVEEALRNAAIRVR